MGKKLFLFAAAAVALASCTETDLSGDTSFAKESTSDAIQFSAKAGNSGVTRAYEKGTIGNDENTTKGIKALKEAQFGVFAYYTGADDYVTETPTVTVKEPNFMYNQQITWSTSNPEAWIYSPVKYWPNGIDADNVNTPSHTAIQKEAGQVSFFAVAPFTTTPTGTYSATTNGKKPNAIGADDTNDDKVKKNDAANGINAMTTNDFTGNVWVKYLMPNATQSEAVDLLWGLAGKNYYNEADGQDPGLKVGEDYNINLTKQKVDEKVSFLFKHALAKIGGAVSNDESFEGTPDVSCGFYVQVDVDENDKDDQPKYFGKGFDNKETLVTIKSVKIQDGATAWSNNTENGMTTAATSTLINSGWFNIETGKWSNDPGTYTTGATYSLEANSSDNQLDNDTYTLNKKFKEVASYGQYESSNVKKMLDGNTQWDTNEPTGVTTTAQPLFCDENVPGLMIIPIEGATSELYVTVDYVVRTADKNLKDGYTNVEQVITNKVSLGSLKPNKYYTIIMHLGLTSVKFEAKVADWTAKAEEAWNPDGTDASTGRDNEEKVWLPSNVVSANQWEITPVAQIPAMGKNDISLTVAINSNNLSYAASPDAGKYSLAENCSWLSFNGSGVITADAYTTSTANRTAIVYVSTKVNGNTITTPITLTQKGYALTGTVSTNKATVKDGDNQAVDLTSSDYTITVSGGDNAGNETHTGNTITVSGTSGQTYKVTVTHTSGATWSDNVTL